MKKSIAFLLLCLASGCRVGPSYTPPHTHAPLHWKAPSSDAPVNCVENWWEIFDDNILNWLEEEALTYNLTVATAVQRVIETRAMATVAGSSLYPQITINPLYTDTGQLFKIFFPPGLIPPTTKIPEVFRIHQFQYFLPVNLNYELDLWGKLHDQYDSAVYTAQASEFDLLSSMLTLTSDVASNYFQLRSLDSQLKVLQATLKERQVELTLAENRFKGGLVTRIDVSNAQILLANAKQTLFDYERQRVLLENMIATLLGMPASEFHLDPNPLTSLPPKIPGGMPSDVLIRRPDIARAERDMASEQALTNAAYASFFPSISLSATVGYSSPDLKDFLKWKSRYWQLGANGAQDVFVGDRDTGNLTAAIARFNEASLTYKNQVLTAFQEVEDALNNIEFQAKQYQSFEEAAQAAREYDTLALQRYKHGLVNYLEVSQAEQAKLQAELGVENMRGVQYVSTVQLIKALGGSWQFNDCVKTSPLSQ